MAHVLNCGCRTVCGSVLCARSANLTKENRKEAATRHLNTRSFAESEANVQIVFEFGAPDLRPVLDVIQHVIGEQSYSIRKRAKESDQYDETDEPLSLVERNLEAGEVLALSIHPTQGPIRYALVIRPLIDGEKRSFFLGTVEYTEKDYTLIWKTILDTPGLIVASIGYEEGVELEDSQLTTATFPWHEWPLVLGALRPSSLNHGSWTIREGPEFHWLQHG